MHSNCSDGTDSPARIAELAAAAGLSGFSLTDHDTVKGLKEAAHRAAELGVEFMPGIELSAHTSAHTIHLLGYDFDPLNQQLHQVLETQQASRAKRNELLIERLNEVGCNITLDEVIAKTKGGSVGRPHFAAVLMDKGYVTSIDQAFVELLGDGKSAYIERRELQARDAIELIHASGGVAVWAHPLRNKKIDQALFDKTLHELRTFGLDGFECWYSRFSPNLRRSMAKTAHKFGMIATGGSDYHGLYKPDLSVGVGTGDLRIPDIVFTQLRERAQKFR